MKKIVSTIAVALGIGSVVSVNQNDNFVDDISKSKNNTYQTEVNSKPTTFSPVRVKAATRDYKKIEQAEGVLSNVEIANLKAEFKDRYKISDTEFSNKYLSNDDVKVQKATDTVKPTQKQTNNLKRSL
ncbi:hypothetical protein H5203_21855 [Pseudoalteromonas sp. SG41-1]|uniref:hypothetical protein n=1 Tax=Pseudoalteromonas sp. SG41-1 TaxID=2760979 RepID=UPI0016037522|nr:hypothetical protein [Pseudoalteromonas sp. SG41-1]MBB1508084.1 hypothetical protein [Pseudoalteromonas sp. SG41-1]